MSRPAVTVQPRHPEPPTSVLNPFETTLIVERSLAGKRIDSFLCRHFRNYTIWRLQEMVSAGCVRMSGEIVTLQQRVIAGERVDVRLVTPPDKLIEPEPIPLRFVYEDAWVLVVDKPPGLIAHPVGAFQSGTLSNALQYHFDRQTARRGLVRPGIVHRLDRMTSGLIVVARDHQSHRRLAQDFENGRVAKSYLAVVCGRVANDTGTIRQPIGQAPGSVLMSVRPDARRLRPARTNYSVVSRHPHCTLVRARPLTGRNHQIRVHLAAIGHPLTGDPYYGPSASLLRTPADVAMNSRHALHAAELEFTHPITREWMAFTSPLPQDMEALLGESPGPESPDRRQTRETTETVTRDGSQSLSTSASDDTA